MYHHLLKYLKYLILLLDVYKRQAFDYLEAPIIRMCNDDNITPFSPMKAKEVLPSSGKLLEKIMQLVEY